MPGGLFEAYSKKDGAYFHVARQDIVEDLKRRPAARVLEIGCGSGATGAGRAIPY